MKKSAVLACVINLFLAFLLVFGVLNPDGSVMNVAVTWVWILILLGVFIGLSTFGSLLLAQSLPDESQRVTLAKLKAAFSKPLPPLQRKVSLAVAAVVVVSLSFAGWMVTALCYVIAIVLVKFAKVVVMEYTKPCVG